MFIFNTGRKILLLKQVSLWVSNLISFPRFFFFFLLKNFCFHLISSADFISCVAMHIAPRKALPSELWSTGVSADFRGLEKRKLCIVFCCCDFLFVCWLTVADSLHRYKFLTVLEPLSCERSCSLLAST